MVIYFWQFIFHNKKPPLPAHTPSGTAPLVLCTGQPAALIISARIPTNIHAVFNGNTSYLYNFLYQYIAHPLKLAYSPLQFSTYAQNGASVGTVNVCVSVPEPSIYHVVNVFIYFRNTVVGSASYHNFRIIRSLCIINLYRFFVNQILLKSRCLLCHYI